MGILDTLAARLGYTKAAAPRIPGEMLSVGDSFHWGMPSATVAERQLNLYAAVTWIATAIDVPAGMAADGKFEVYKTAGRPGEEDDEELVTHPFLTLMGRPNPLQSKSEFLRDAYTLYKATGNLYIFKNAPSETAPPDELWLVPSHMIEPIPDGRSYVAGYKFTVPGKPAEFIPTWQISHMKTANPLNPFVGLSALQSLAIDAYGDLAQQKWNLAHFDKNNAKLPSILAFKHMVGDPEWKKIKQERDQEWGGTNRAGVTLLRGVGDSLQLIQASATQKDMEFLEGRNFTKEEIYGRLAPGLASILAVNATEANAIAGKSTLIEFGVWPVMVQIQEKINSDILPLYGEGLYCEVEDMRQTNRILDLQEQTEFAKYHTLNEVRSEYYGDGPMELDPAVIAAMPEKPASNLDERGFLLAAQVGPGTPAPKIEAPKPEPAAPIPPPPDNSMPAADMPSDAMPADSMPPMPDGAAMTAQQKAELQAWERWAIKRLGKPAGREFEPRALDLFTAGRIRAALKAAATADDVRRAFAEQEAPGPAQPTLADLLAELKSAYAKLETL